MDTNSRYILRRCCYIAALSIGDYAKTSEVNTAISTALGSYYIKTEVDTKLGDCDKTSGIETVTEAEVRALFADSET